MMRDRFAYDRLSITSVCETYDLSRQAYYKSVKKDLKTQLEKEKVLMLVRECRKQLVREGGRKLYKRLRKDFMAMGLKIGRDKLFDILREAGMLVEPRKKYVCTTQSYHRFYIHPNRIINFKPSSVNKLWVCDITYIRTREGFMFLALITDAYSRKIVGYDISDSLELEGCLRALKMALLILPKDHKLIHHSDRGVQYCSYEYTDLLKENGIDISMASKGNCYENAMAERVNGILKQEFYLDETFGSKQEAIKACAEAIRLYNQVRFHECIDYMTPEQKHVA
jgi:transposase InsO family protein